MSDVWDFPFKGLKWLNLSSFAVCNSPPSGTNFYVSHFSVAVIKHHGRKQRRDERVYFGLQFQRDKKSPSRQRRLGSKSMKLRAHTFHGKHEADGAAWEWGKAVHSQCLSLVIQCFLQSCTVICTVTFPNSTTNLWSQAQMPLCGTFLILTTTLCKEKHSKYFVFFSC